MARRKDSSKWQPPQGGVCLLGLRLSDDHPMFLATDRHYTQGAMDHTKIAWDAASRQLSGVFDATPDTDYTLRILVPPPYTFQQARCVHVSRAKLRRGERLATVVPLCQRREC